MSRKLRLALAALCFVVACVLAAAYANGVHKQAEQLRQDALERYGGEVASLVVCTRELEAGQVVEAGDVEVRDWLADLAPAEAYTSLDAVLGKMVSVPCQKGSPLTELNFREEQGRLEVPDGCVALAIPVTERLGCPADIAPRTTVAAYVANEHETVLLSGNVQVLSSGGQASSLGGTQLTLAASPDDAPRLLAASAAGELRLVVPAEDVATLSVGVGGSADSVAAEPKEQDTQGTDPTLDSLEQNTEQEPSERDVAEQVEGADDDG